MIHVFNVAYFCYFFTISIKQLIEMLFAMNGNLRR